MWRKSESKDNMKLQKIFDLIITFGVWILFLLIGVHEMGHALVANLYKVPYAVTFGIGYGQLVASEYGFWIYPAGGLLAAFISGLLWWRAKVSPTNWDMDDEAVLAVVAVSQVGAAIGETIAYFWGNISILEIVFSGAFAIPVAIVYWNKVLDWVDEK